MFAAKVPFWGSSDWLDIYHPQTLRFPHKSHFVAMTYSLCSCNRWHTDNHRGLLSNPLFNVPFHSIEHQHRNNQNNAMRGTAMRYNVHGVPFCMTSPAILINCSWFENEVQSHGNSLLAQHVNDGLFGVLFSKIQTKRSDALTGALMTMDTRPPPWPWYHSQTSSSVLAPSSLATASETDSVFPESPFSVEVSSLDFDDCFKSSSSSPSSFPSVLSTFVCSLEPSPLEALSAFFSARYCLMNWGIKKIREISTNFYRDLGNEIPHLAAIWDPARIVSLCTFGRNRESDSSLYEARHRAERVKGHNICDDNESKIRWWCHTINDIFCFFRWPPCCAHLRFLLDLSSDLSSTCVSFAGSGPSDAMI